MNKLAEFSKTTLIGGTWANVPFPPATGVFTWRPALAQAPSTNLISLAVTDNGSPAMD